jgi:DNA replication and repair protein RecF
LARVEKLSAFIGRFPCVIIIPDDNSLILGHGELRRRFLDATLSQFSSEYLSNLMIYNKVLAQRNALLKSFYEQRNFDRNLLEVYNASLISCSKVIFQYRIAFMEKFIPVFQAIYHQIFNGQEDSSITYDSELNNIDIEELIIKTEQQDRMAQRTTKGIHTDDLVFQLNGHPLKKVGSQGQQKTFLLSLKLAQYELLKQEKQIYPILLLDDIFDKLDPERVSKIFKLIHDEAFGQVFITHTEPSSVDSLIIENQIVNYNIIKLGSI